MSASSSTTHPVRKHRREVWTQIVGPVALSLLAVVALCVALAVGVGAGALVGKQVTVVMSCVATAFIAFPLAILCLVPYFLLVMGAHLSGQAYAHARTPLRFTRRLSGQVALQTNRHAPKLARPLIGLNVRYEVSEGIGIRLTGLPKG